VSRPARGSTPPPLRWWGWGDRDTALAEPFLALLRDELGAASEAPPECPRIEHVSLLPGALPARLRRRLVETVGGFHVRDDSEERIRHAAGRSYLDLIALRSGRVAEAPDAVVHPASDEEIQTVLRVCADADCSVMPFGGGTSVVGGVNASRDRGRPLIALALDRMDLLLDVDRSSLTATLQAGSRGPWIESELAQRGLTLGHHPQSFEYATAGGYAATRSAGQASTGYGRFDQMLSGLRMLTPTGALTVPAGPPRATGPSLLDVIAGSEGVLGVISEVTVRVRSRPRLRHYAAWSLQTFHAGAGLIRDLLQSGRAPDVVRLADAEETRASLAMARGAAARMARRYLAARGHASPCLLILGWEGDGQTVGARVRAASSTIRGAGAVALGERPAQAWLYDRFEGPYLRDALLDRGLLVETVETSAPWHEMASVRGAVVDALRASLEADGTAPLVGSHLSHAYRDGASLYFTVLARRLEGDAVGQWTRAKRAATDAIVASGGALSHHHGIGLDHAAWMTAAHGDRGIAVLRAIKKELDPAGIMNPNKLIPPE
jgi:alkyldihydroxyacetonephosphate synthase